MKVTTIKGETIDLVPGGNFAGAMLRDLTLDGVNVAGADFRDCYFNESSLVGANLSECLLDGAVFYMADLSGADLTGASLDKCYWSAVRVDASTKWPEGFDISVIDFGKWTDSSESPEEPESLLASPGITHADDVDVELGRPASFVPKGFLHGQVASSSEVTLMMRLAGLIFRAVKVWSDRSPDALERDLGLFAPDEPDLDGDWGDVVFTHIVFALHSLGLNFVAVRDRESVDVNFRPVRHMSKLVASDQFKLFQYLCEDIDEPREDWVTFENLADTEPIGDVNWVYLEDLPGGFDFSNAWNGTERVVSFVEFPRRADEPREELLGGLCRYLALAGQSRWVSRTDLADPDEDVYDDEVEDDDYEEDDDEYGDRASGDLEWSVLLFLIWDIMGLESITRHPNGSINAVMRPRLDYEKVLANLAEVDDEPEDDVDDWTKGFLLRPTPGLTRGFMIRDEN